MSQTRSAPGSRLLDGDPSTRWPVVESVEECGTVGKCVAGGALECAENSEKEEACSCQGPGDQMTE